MGKLSLKEEFHVVYNNVIDSDIGVHVSSRPSIPSAREIINSFTIPGRDGSLTIRDGTVEDIAIQVDFSFTAYPDMWQRVAYMACDWLIGHSGAVLRFSDMPGIFYKVKYVEVSDIERAHKKIGTFSAVFTCDGYQYLDTGLIGMPAGTLTNNYSTSHPIYTITATTDGTCTLTVGSKSIQATIAQNLTIDTDLMLAYRIDGTRIIANTALIMGNLDFKDLWLPHGATVVSVSSGFTLQIQPNWRRI